MSAGRRRVLVTGASRGIGRAVARAFAQRGDVVALGYRANEDAAAAALAALPGEGHRVFQADLTDLEQARALVDRAADAMSGLDVLIGNAGGGRRHRIDEDDAATWSDAWREVLDLNLVAQANLAHAAARRMIEGGGGRMVFVSSRGAFRGEPDQPAYGAAKAGLNAMAQSLAVQLAPYRIYVHVVAPGFVDTDLARDRLDGPGGDAIRAQSPTGRVATPEEVAHVALFLASEGAEFTTGTIVDVNGASYLRN
ncbi:MAG: SDR family oxidoreductase [Trueperaceae bacterium]